mgnify:CR=1 FL=1
MEDRVIQKYVSVLKDYATSVFAAPCYCVIAYPTRCAVCDSERPNVLALWLVTRDVAVLFRRSDGRLFAGALYATCSTCHARLGRAIAHAAEEKIRAQLDGALRGSGETILEEVVT